MGQATLQKWLYHRNHKIFWVGKDPEGSPSPTLKWMVHKDIKPVTLALLAPCSSQLRMQTFHPKTGFLQGSAAPAPFQLTLGWQLQVRNKKPSWEVKNCSAGRCVHSHLLVSSHLLEVYQLPNSLGGIALPKRCPYHFRHRQPSPSSLN